MTPTPPPRDAATAWLRLRLRLRLRLCDDSIFIASGWLLGVAGFVLVVTGLSAAAGLIVVWVGVLVAAGTLLGARCLAHLQRAQLRRRCRRAAPDPQYLRAGADAGWLRRALVPLRDPQSWLDAAWAVLALVTGTVALVVSVTWWAVTAGALTYWFWQRWLPDDNVGLAELLGWGGKRADSLLNLVVGVVALVLLPWVVRGCALLHGNLADVLLCSRARWQSQVRRVTHSRSASRQAETQSLRRLERDLHDGPQQSMVRLTMDIGRARRQLDTDPGQAGLILDDALIRARGTTEELRALSRGIAPPLLVDRGLQAAVEELLQRSPTPRSCCSRWRVCARAACWTVADRDGSPASRTHSSGRPRRAHRTGRALAPSPGWS
ncbi:sensor histidine kinase [Kineococcus sp. TBRC 1896]|uniref:histidine kinase n=1 Tax=Kineococcus mangrovi TaxID=1660183 RepID=A0ABV4I4Q6_9ACTN